MARTTVWMAALAGLLGVAFVSALDSRQTQNRVACLSCERVARPEDCMIVHQCPPDEYCYTERYITEDAHIFFDLGCRPAQVCRDASLMAAPFGRRREVPSEAIVVCERCCDGKFCNQRLCGGQEPPVLKCLSCNNMGDAANCRHLEVCEPHESCGIMEKLTPDFNLAFDLGCQHTEICTALASQALTPGGLCSNCCNASLCNDVCTTPSPPPTTVQPSTTTEKPTIPPPTTTEKPTIPPPTTTEKPTTLPPTTTKRPTTPPPTTTEKPTTPTPTTTKKPTTQPPTTTEKPTIPLLITTEKPTTLPPIMTKRPTTPPPTTTEKPTTPTTTDQPTTLPPTTTEQSTTQPSTTTEQSTTPPPTPTDQPTTPPKVSITQPSTSPISSLAEVCATQASDVTVSPPRPVTSLLAQIGCGGPQEVVFLVDSSPRVSPEEKQAFQRLLDNLALTLNLGPQATRLAYLTYDTYPHTVLGLSQGTDIRHIDLVITNYSSSLQPSGPQSRLDRALNAIRTSQLSAYNTRPGAKRVVVIFSRTDPFLHDEAVAAAQRLRSEGAEVLVVLVDHGLSGLMWQQVATGPESTYFLHFPDVESMVKQVEPILAARCVDPNVTATLPSKICNVGNLLSMLGCGAKEDIVFVLDRSFSIGRTDWPKMAAFTHGVVAMYDVSPATSRVALLSYSTNLSQHITWTDFTHRQQLLHAIDMDLGQLHPAGYTNTHLALQWAAEAFRTSGRSDAVKVVILLTDGGSTSKLETLAAGTRLHLEGVQVFVIGIGRDVDLTEQAFLATDPDNFHMLNIRDQSALLQYLELLALEHCRGISASPPATTPTPVT